ncbi:roadblock/LC7 domain-containing protein [Streptomyces sp. NBC_01361]|nr:roadblock/LC7 domain-containing protein [Streptomyces sp. NBC_01361]
MTPTFTVTNLGDNPDDHGTGGAGGVDWLLDDLVDRVAEVRYVVMLSTDGLCVGASHGLGRDESERFAAIASGFHSLAKGAGRHFDAGGVVQTMVELHGGFLFVVAAGDGSCIAVFTDGHADIGLVAYEMALLVERVREHLAVPARTDGAPTPDGGTS